MWKNVAESDISQMTIWRMRIACWITNATDPHRVCNTYCFPTATVVTRNVSVLRCRYRVYLVTVL